MSMMLQRVSASCGRPTPAPKLLVQRVPRATSRPHVPVPRTACRAVVASSPIVSQAQNDASFEEMLTRSETPLLVDFYATWCGPCQLISPVLSNVADRMKDEVRVVKIDTDKCPDLASRYRIRALPTLMLFREGQPVDRMQGLMSEKQLCNRLSYFLHKFEGGRDA